jgi:ribosomal protein L20
MVRVKRGNKGKIREAAIVQRFFGFRKSQSSILKSLSHAYRARKTTETRSFRITSQLTSNNRLEKSYNPIHLLKKLDSKLGKKRIGTIAALDPQALDLLLHPLEIENRKL